MEILIYIIAAVASLFAWNVIHEMSHILAAMAFGDIVDWKIKPYPHMKDGKFRFAGAEWTWVGEVPGKEKKAWISFAPRIPNILAAFLLFVGFYLTGVIQITWLIFCFAGIIDLAVGSLGISETSDLRKASVGLEINPWVFRVFGFTVSVTSIITILLIILL